MADKSNGTWTKVMVCIMGGISLFSTGWAASSTVAWTDVRRIDTQGSQKTVELMARVAKVETTLDICLGQLQNSIKDLTYLVRTQNDQLAQHIQSYGGSPAKKE